MNTVAQIETAFSALPPDEREAVIAHGAALRLSSLKQRLFLAESKVRAYEEKYQTTYQELHETGLPDDASVEMHEDYIIWSHWVDVIEQSKRDLQILEQITHQGLSIGETINAGR